MKIEVCCGSYCDALEAFKGGADRVELCSSLFFGGLTPSIGSLKMLKKKTDLEVSVMVRPREGGFCYTEEEFELMLCDAQAFIENGADGIVFGFLHSDGTLDYERTRIFTEHIGKKCKAVFHKALDVSKSPLLEGAKMLKNIGIDRILTSGGKKTALLGADNIKKLIEIGGIEIMAGGSVRNGNIEELYNKTGCTWVHTSGFESRFDLSMRSEEIFFTGKTAPEQGEYSLVNHKIIEEITQTGRKLI